MIAVLGILMDSYRSLRAQWLFWIVLLLSLCVVVGLASFGFDEEGYFVFFGAWSFEHGHIRAGTPFAKTLYMGIFSAIIVDYWLAWAATILALISTSSIYPTFLSERSVELVMSKPVRRTTLFFAKYLGGLLFVILQVGIFCLGAFLVAGWRVDEWNPSIFLAIPLVTVFFSYLFCVCTLIGVVTRSTLIALLGTILLWFGSIGIRGGDSIVSHSLFRAEVLIEFQVEVLDSNRQQLAEFEE